MKMKIEIQRENRELVAFETGRVYVYDEIGSQFEIIIDKFGGIEITKTEGAISIHPHVSNNITLK